MPCGESRRRDRRRDAEEEIACDEAREAYLRAQGFRIFRAHNGEVYENIDGVCNTLLAFIRHEID